MDKKFIPKVLGGALVCLVGVFSAQQAHAQAELKYNVLYGNSIGTGSNFQITAGRAGDATPYIHMYGNDNADANNAGSINLISGYNPNQSVPAYCFANRTSSGGWMRAMQILQNGRIQIGTRAPSAHPDYRLAVDGKLVSTSVYVTNPSNWADFVFAPSYKLMPLAELESYLKVNHHLPAIPAANEVEAKGYSVTDMDAKLLRSVEELTLHVIELSKQNAQMRVELNSLRATTHKSSKATQVHTR